MRLLLLLLFTVHGTRFTVSAQELFRRDIPLTESGTPVRVNDIVADDLGALWLGTENGLYRYNGRTVTEEPPASTRRPVSALAAQGSAVFVGFADGNVMVMRSGMARRIFGTASASSITCLLPTPLGLLVATGGDGIALLRPGTPPFRITARSGLADDFVYTLALDTPRGQAPRLLAGTDRGITVVTLAEDGLKFTTLNTRNTPGLRDDIVRVIRPIGTAGGAFFVGTQAGGAARLWWNKEGWPVAHWEMQYRSEDEPGAQINDVLPLNIYTTAEARDDGFFIPRTAPSEHGFRAAYTQAGRAVHRVLQDTRGGGLWLGTADGLQHLSYATVHRKPAHNGYALSGISALAQQGDALWYAQDRRLYRRDEAGNILLRYTAPETITSLCPDWRGRLWIGTLGGGLLCMDAHGVVQPVASVEALRGGHILAISAAWDTLFVASLSGVEELEVVESRGKLTARSIRHHGRAGGAGSDYVYALLHGRRSELWMATDGAGVVMWDGKKYRRFDTAQGFAPRVVYALAQSPTNGDVWAGTLEGGLLRWDGVRWTHFRKEQGLPGNTVFAIAALADGSVVATTDGGIAQWLPASGEFRHFDARAGVTIDSFSFALNAVTLARDGSAVLPVKNGFLHIEPAIFSRFSIPDYRPRVALRSIELFGEPLRDRRHRFAPEENGIGFRWEGIHPAEAHHLRYRYRLRGYGRDAWVQTADEAIDFARLPPGRYIFEVEAALHTDFGGAARAVYGFAIAAPVWKRWWFWTVVVVATAVVFYALLERRDRARQRLATIQQARLRAEYEGLKSQVNPHFLFNSLNTLVSLIEEDPAAAARYTEQLSDLYRDTLSFRNRDVVTLEEEWAVLQKYLYIQQSRFGEALRVETSFADGLLQSGRIIPLALQLLVENAIKHNVVSRARPLLISITAAGDTVTVRNALRPKASPEKGTGIGLENIRNRYALLTTRAVSASKSGEYFTVALPLI